jgi:hypothetical protein
LATPLLARQLVGVPRVGGRDDQLRARLEPAELLHDEERVVEPARVLFEPQRLGHRHRAAVEGAVGAELDRALGLDQAAGRIAAQDQPPRHLLVAGAVGQPEAVGLARGAAEDALEPADAHVLGLRHPVRRVGGQPLLERHVPQRPRKVGSRFSSSALTPSRKSWVSNERDWSCAS